jgi:hypothetical protein
LVLLRDKEVVGVFVRFHCAASADTLVLGLFVG